MSELEKEEVRAYATMLNVQDFIDKTDDGAFLLIRNNLVRFKDDAIRELDHIAQQIADVKRVWEQQNR